MKLAHQEGVQDLTLTNLRIAYLYSIFASLINLLYVPLFKILL